MILPWNPRMWRSPSRPALSRVGSTDIADVDPPCVLLVPQRLPGSGPEVVLGLRGRTVRSSHLLKRNRGSGQIGEVAAWTRSDRQSAIGVTIGSDRDYYTPYTPLDE